MWLETDLDDAGRIEPVCGLVEDEQLGLVEECAGKGETLQVAKRERPGSAVGVLAETELVDQSCDGRSIVNALEPPGDLEVLADGQLGIRGRALDKVADAAPHGRRLGAHRFPEQLGVTCRWRDHPEEHPDRRRLAGAVGAEEPVDLAPGDAEVHAVDGQDIAAVALGEPERRDGELAHRTPSRPWPSPRRMNALSSDATCSTSASLATRS
jgi:hypothetical protein